MIPALRTTDWRYRTWKVETGSRIYQWPPWRPLLIGHPVQPQIACGPKMEHILTAHPDGTARKGFSPGIEVQHPGLFCIGEHFMHGVQKIVVFDLCHIVWFKLS